MIKLASLAVLAAALSAIPNTAKAQSSVTCESSRGRRETCRVDTRGEVRLTQQLSDTRCVRGRNWGTLPGAVWVDDGCRARFTSYGNRGGSWGNNDRNGRGNDDRYGRGNGRWDDHRNDGRWNDRNNGRRDDDRGRVISGSWAMGRCQQAVRRQVNSNRHLNFWVEDTNRNDVRVGWRADNRLSGTCRVDRDGRVDVRYDRRR
jgi:hypothetical protein